MGAVCVGLGLLIAPNPRAAGAAVPRARQVITVEAASPSSTVALVRTWVWAGNRYLAKFPPTIANVGVHGVGPTREGLGRTPVGVFTMTWAFGNVATDGTRLPYFRTGPDDWWDENPASAEYNRLVVSPYSPGGDSENLYDAGVAYSHAVVINYNSNPVVKGAGSGFFLHVSTGFPTAGCVALNARALNQIMRWLVPVDHPVISIAVGPSVNEVLKLH